MFQQEIVVGPTPLTGPISVEIGTVAIILRKNEIVDVLGPGRYSRSRLAMSGVFPTAVSVFLVRTALTRFTTDCYNVRLGDSRVDLRVVVQARLRLDSDLKTFFRNVMGMYGTDFGTQAPVILHQLVEEGLQGASVDRDHALGSSRNVRASLGAAMEPSDIFEIVDVVSYSVIRDDPIAVQIELEGRLRPVERARRLAEIELAAEEGELRAAGCIRLAERLGVDPLYLWDPEGFRDQANSQRQAFVQLVGQYGENLAVLAEATNMNTDVLSAVLGPMLPDLRGPARALRASGQPSALGPKAVLGLDPSVAELMADAAIDVAGGVLRTAEIDGKQLRLLLLATSREQMAETRRIMGKALGDKALVGVFDAGLPADSLAREVISWVTGSAREDVHLSQGQGQLIWRLPSAMTRDRQLAEFAAETICDLFESPALLPVES